MTETDIHRIQKHMASKKAHDALNIWLEALDAADVSKVDAGTVAELTACMRESVGFRDAIVMSIIGKNHPRYADSTLRDYAFDPERSQQLIPWFENTMRRAVTLGGQHEDFPRARCAITLLLAMAIAVTPTDKALATEPLAIAGYTLWWMGDPFAESVLRQAFDINEGHTLANLVQQGINTGYWPGHSDISTENRPGIDKLANGI